MDDNSIFGLRKPLPRCKHLKIYRRKFGYNHHIFVGEADESGCDIYHYSISLLPLLKMCSPAQIKKERLEYSSYMENKEIMKLFNWNNGDRVAIVDRDDYPENEIAENECIARAESRLGETYYSIAYNNCESFVNWIFSGDNTSNEFRNASLLTQITSNVFEEFIYTGGSNFFLHLCLEILENLNDFLVSKSVTQTIFFCNRDKNNLNATNLTSLSNFHRQIGRKILEIQKMYNYERQTSDCHMLRICSEDPNAQSSIIKDIVVTLSERYCNLGICSEKLLYISSGSSIGFDIAPIKCGLVGNMLMEESYSYEEWFKNSVYRGTEIGIGSLKTVQTGLNPRHFKCSVYATNCTLCTVSDSMTSNYLIAEGVDFMAHALKVLNAYYLTNTQRILSTTRKAAAVLVVASLSLSNVPNSSSHTHVSNDFNSERNDVENTYLFSLNMSNLKTETKSIATDDHADEITGPKDIVPVHVPLHVDRGISFHMPATISRELHSLRQPSCGFMNNTITEFQNCPANICIAESQCLIL